MKDIFLPPAGRAEFIVTGPSEAVGTATLETLNIATGPAGDNDPARTLAVLKPENGAGGSLPRLPAVSATPGPQRFEGLDRAQVTARRKLYFSETPTATGVTQGGEQTNFFITVDGAKPTVFSPTNPPAITTTQGAVEDWTIENRSAEVHEFHMHQIHFKLLARDGKVLPENEQQFFDTVQVPFWSGTGPYPSITVRMDFRGRVVGDFVYHCHILGHEDARHDGDHPGAAEAAGLRRCRRCTRGACVSCWLRRSAAWSPAAGRWRCGRGAVRRSGSPMPTTRRRWGSAGGSMRRIARPATGAGCRASRCGRRPMPTARGGRRRSTGPAIPGSAATRS